MIGQTISHYKILEKLGEGGMGVVYKADDTKLRRAVALKFLAPELTRDAEAKKRFIHEAQAVSALDHPNIAVVHEVDETDDGRSFICMAYYPGKTLKELINEGPLPIDKAIEIAVQIADGLQRAHEAGIIHRDIKPANIILTERGEVKIVDFGIAKLMGQSHPTRTKTTAGTAAYMSPEQAQGLVIDKRSDLFSLGIVLYEMLTGKRPFQGEHEAAVLYSIVSVDPPPPSSLNPAVPPLLDMAVMRLLEKDPAKRYLAAADLEKDLRDAIDGYRPIARRRDYVQLLASRKVLIPTGGLLLVFLLLVFLPRLLERVTGVSLPGERNVAVLPFTNISGSEQTQALCDGLLEILSSKLTQLEPENTWVIAASEIRQKKISSAQEAYSNFGATMAITGSVQDEGNRLRLTLNLVEAKNGRQLRSVVLDQQRSNLSSFQDDLIVSLATMLELEVPEERLDTPGKTDASQAYELYLRGRGYLQRFERVENIVTAIDQFRKAIAIDSSYALAWAGLGEALWRRYEATKDVQWVNDAVEVCQTALALNSQLAPVHVSLGVIYRGTGKYEEAIQEFQQAIEIDRFNTDAYRETAIAYAALNDVKRAEETYKKAIELRPRYWAGHNMLGVFYFRQGRLDEAAQMFKKVIELSPENITGYNNLGGIYFYQKKWGKAREEFERSARLYPTYIVYSQLGTLYFYERRYDDAVVSYEKALQMQNTDYRVWGYLASAYRWSGQNDKSNEALERAAAMVEEQRKVNPRDASLCYLLAGYYAALGKHMEARTLAKEALSLAPTDMRVVGRVGIIYERLGDREEALRLIARAIQTGALSSIEIESDPEMRSLIEDPRYKMMVQHGR